MKSFFLALALGSCITLSAQRVVRCVSSEYLHQRVDQHPELVQTFYQFGQTVSKNKSSAQRGKVRIIPVVFHVFHTYGDENISKDQILDQMRILNEDFRRNNSDASNTRQVFKSVAVDCEIEFRLATKDPQGNCTDGIVRVYDEQTADGTDALKYKSYWPSDQYLNVWVVKEIDKSISSTVGGIVLGYAQFPFPGSGDAATDGVMIRADYIGSIGTAANNGNNGRVATHEIGHWLGLFHTFEGGCNGGFWDDQCDDTPYANSANFGCDYNVNSCYDGVPDPPDQIENYMDYSNGSCQNMFTADQKARMDNVFANYRTNIISTSNLQATGTDQNYTTLCAPIPDFYAPNSTICEGNSVAFSNFTYGGKESSRTWYFEGGTPATDTSLNPTVTYPKEGSYQVKLVASNSAGSDSIVRTQYVVVLPAVSPLNAPVSYDFESTNQLIKFVVNSDNSIGWKRSNRGASNGTYSYYLANYGNTTKGTKASFILPSVNISAASTRDITFYYATTQRSSQSSDRLIVSTSIDCGNTWISRFNRSGAALSTTGSPQNSDFAPSAGDWKKISVNLGTTTATNLLVKFELTSSGQGNNLYIDQINLGSGTTGVEIIPENELSVYPNPTEGTLWIQAPGNEPVFMQWFDAKGAQIGAEIRMESGHGSLSLDQTQPGVYFLHMRQGNQVTVKKVVLVKP